MTQRFYQDSIRLYGSDGTLRDSCVRADTAGCMQGDTPGCMQEAARREERKSSAAETAPVLLVLGGGIQQMPALEAARRMGIRTVLADYTKGCPGEALADTFLGISTTDVRAVTEAAREHHVNGILAFASDPAAYTAARAAADLGLPGNPPEAAEILGNKKLFRDFLRKNGFPTPAYHVLSENAEGYGHDLSFPLIVKPADSSGSRGVRPVWKSVDFLEAYRDAVGFSRVGMALEEQMIQFGYSHVIGGDILVQNGRIILNGLMDCYREPAHALVPCGKSWPMDLDLSIQHAVLAVLQRIVTLLEIRTAEMNVELILGSDGRIYPVDIGLRSGGNGIPRLLSDITGVDLAEWNIRAALGWDTSFRPGQDGCQNLPAGFQSYEGADTALQKQKSMEDASGDETRFRRGNPGIFMTYNLHVEEDGYYAGVEIDPVIRGALYRTKIFREPGDPIRPYVNVSHVIGIFWMHFPDRNSMQPYYRIMRDLIRTRYYRIEYEGDRDKVLAALWRLGRYLPHRSCGEADAERQYEEQIVMQGETWLALTAKRDAVGMLSMYRNDPMKNTAFITALSVAPEYRRCRIAERLCEAAERAAIRKGFAAIEGEIRADNNGCLALAEKLGYCRSRESGKGRVIVRKDLMRGGSNPFYSGKIRKMETVSSGEPAAEEGPQDRRLQERRPKSGNPGVME